MKPLSPTKSTRRAEYHRWSLEVAFDKAGVTLSTEGAGRGALAVVDPTIPDAVRATNLSNFVYSGYRINSWSVSNK